MDLREQLAQVKGKLSLLRAEFPVPADELPDEFFAREGPLRAEQQRLVAAIYDTPEAKRERTARAKADAQGRHVAGYGHYPELLSEDPKEIRRCSDPERVKTGDAKIRHFACDDGSFHLLQWIEDGRPVSGLTLKAERPWRGQQSATVDTVFTDPTFRRQGLAASLLKYARTYFRKVAHSKDLTAQGRAWKKAVRNGPKNKRGAWVPREIQIRDGVDKHGLKRNADSGNRDLLRLASETRDPENIARFEQAALRSGQRRLASVREVMSRLVRDGARIVEHPLGRQLLRKTQGSLNIGSAVQIARVEGIQRIQKLSGAGQYHSFVDVPADQAGDLSLYDGRWGRVLDIAFMWDRPGTDDRILVMPVAVEKDGDLHRLLVTQVWAWNHPLPPWADDLPRVLRTARITGVMHGFVVSPAFHRRYPYGLRGNSPGKGKVRSPMKRNADDEIRRLDRAAAADSGSRYRQLVAKRRAGRLSQAESAVLKGLEDRAVEISGDEFIQARRLGLEVPLPSVAAVIKATQENPDLLALDEWSAERMLEGASEEGGEGLVVSRCVEDGADLRLFFVDEHGTANCLVCGFMQSPDPESGFDEACKQFVWHDLNQYGIYRDVARAGGYTVPDVPPRYEPEEPTSSNPAKAPMKKRNAGRDRGDDGLRKLRRAFADSALNDEEMFRLISGLVGRGNLEEAGEVWIEAMQRGQISNDVRCQIDPPMTMAIAKGILALNLIQMAQISPGKMLSDVVAARFKAARAAECVESGILVCGFRYTERSPDVLASLVYGWLVLHRMDHDAGTYTKEQWLARGEQVGTDSLFTLTSEGPFSAAMHGYDRPGPDDEDVPELFNGFLAGLGLHYDRGYSWSWHFYTQDLLKSRMETAEKALFAYDFGSKVKSINKWTGTGSGNDRWANQVRVEGQETPLTFIVDFEPNSDEIVKTGIMWS